MLHLIAYNLILLSLLPVFLLWGLWRLARGKSRSGWAQRLGLLHGVVGGLAQGQEINSCPTGLAQALQGLACVSRETQASARQSSLRIWVHACSVGEVNAARPVLKELRKELPTALIFLSTITPTGQAQARRACPQADAVFYFPLDLLPCVWLALRAIRPDLCLLMEKELWPNFLAVCRMRGVPILVANGAISDHTLSRLNCFRRFLRWVAGMVTFFSVQTEEDRRRLLLLGVGASRIGVDGNTKFDQPIPEPGEEEALGRLLGWGEEVVGLVAGSTHAGEEEIAVEAYLRLRGRHPRARLLLAPRHPERAAEVAALLEKHRLRWLCRSELGKALSVARPLPGAAMAASEGGLAIERSALNVERTTKDAESPVVILDTIGELALAYRLARAAFVGGSLVSHVGGHNPLEVVAEGRPVFWGPQMRNFRDLACLLRQEGVGDVIHSASELAHGWQRAIEDEEWLKETQARAREVMFQHRGASRRAVQRALAILSARRPYISDSGSKSEQNLAPSPRPSSGRVLRIDSQLGRGRAYLLGVVGEREKGLLAGLLRAGLGGLAGCYRAGLTANLALYQTRLFSRKRFSCPVISIGNITLGGTGKTLATLTLCQWLLRRGRKPAVLSHGYAGNASAPRVVSDGENLKRGPREAGDEAFLLAASLPGVPVLVGKDRRRSGEMALGLGAQVLVLDDGFQYWKLEKDCEIVLVDALNPFGNGRLIPRGFLREPVSALRRAQAIWITHSDLVGEEALEALERTLAGIAWGVPIWRTVHQPIALRDFASGEKVGLWTLEGKRVLALSGIGNPASFELLLERLGAEVVAARFPDHHLYGEKEIADLLACAAAEVSVIITTAKDAVRLPKGLRTSLPLRLLEVRMNRYSAAGLSGMEEIFAQALPWLTREE